jgi:hypothetical protein
MGMLLEVMRGDVDLGRVVDEMGRRTLCVEKTRIGLRLLRDGLCVVAGDGGVRHLQRETSGQVAAIDGDSPLLYTMIHR